MIRSLVVALLTLGVAAKKGKSPFRLTVAGKKKQEEVDLNNRFLSVSNVSTFATYLTSQY